MPNDCQKRPRQTEALYLLWAYAEASCQIQKDEVEALLRDYGEQFIVNPLICCKRDTLSRATDTRLCPGMNPYTRGPDFEAVAKLYK